MKKNFSKLLIIAFLCLFLTLLLCVFSINIGNANSLTEDIISLTVDTNAPLFLLFGLGVGLLGDLSYAIIISFTVLILPTFLLLIITILQIVARLMQIGVEKHWKNITSRVLTWISIVLQVLVCCVLIFNILNYPIVRKFVLVVALGLNITSIVLFVKELVKSKKLIQK